MSQPAKDMLVALTMVAALLLVWALIGLIVWWAL